MKTALLQAPSLSQTVIGQGFAVAVTVAAVPLLTFVASAVASETIQLSDISAVPPTGGSFAPIGGLLIAVVTGSVIAVAYGAIGFCLGHLLRNTGPAMALALLWSLVVDPTLTGQIAPVLHGVGLAIYDLLPAAATSSLTFLFGTGGYVDLGSPEGAQLPTVPSLTILGLYCFAGLTLPVLFIRRRGVA